MLPKQSCWTCKRKMRYPILNTKLTSVGRKIGCDRDTPSCNNCIRTQRKCLGYGLQLLWPDRHDGRRRKRDPVEHRPPISLPEAVHYGKYFLNTSVLDVDLAVANSKRQMVVDLFCKRPQRSLTLHGHMLNQYGILLGYCV
jgi:hypothetical protein